MKTPITSAALKHHITYNFWKYILIAILAFGLVDLLYSATAYKPPRDKIIELNVYGMMDEPALAEYMSSVQASEMSDMEEMKPVQIMDDDYYGPMQLLTWMANGQGDVYVLPHDEFVNHASTGAFVALEDDAELMALFNEAGVSLQSGWRRDTETGETHLFGIPLSRLPGLDRYAYARDGYLCVAVTGGNIENALKFTRILCRDMITAPEPAAEDTQTAEPPAL